MGGETIPNTKGSTSHRRDPGPEPHAMTNTFSDAFSDAERYIEVLFLSSRVRERKPPFSEHALAAWKSPEMDTDDAFGHRLRVFLDAIASIMTAAPDSPTAVAAAISRNGIFKTTLYFTFNSLGDAEEASIMARAEAHLHRVLGIMREVLPSNDPDLSPEIGYDDPACQEKIKQLIEAIVNFYRESFARRVRKRRYLVVAVKGYLSTNGWRLDEHIRETYESLFEHIERHISPIFDRDETDAWATYLTPKEVHNLLTIYVFWVGKGILLVPDAGA
jgi:hypothetical protein